MFLWALVPSHVPLDFPRRPIAAEVARGAAIQKKGAGPDRTLLEDHRVAARWFDGRIRRPSDTITWVSPDLASRWFGYLAANDGWTDAALDRRWAAARESLQGSLTFIVRLSAMPKVDPLEFGTGSLARESELDNVKFEVNWSQAEDGKLAIWHPTSFKAVKSASIQKYDWAPILNRQFFELTRLAPLFMDDGMTNEPDDGILLGDRFGAVYVITAPLDSDLESATMIEMDVIRKRRTERERFMLIPPEPSRKHVGRSR
jgi:hypothetical protein